MGNMEQAVAFMEMIAMDDCHGYDQSKRNGPDYDCSSLVGAALSHAGYDVLKTSTTRNLLNQLRTCGFTDCKKPWKRGDIHLKVNAHVCVSIDEKRIVHARINEKGTVSGGKTGDQTGNEITITDYYEYEGGWDYHLRDTLVLTDMIPPDDAKIQSIVNSCLNGSLGSGDGRRKNLVRMNVSPLAIQCLVNFESTGTFALYRDICAIIAFAVSDKNIDVSALSKEYSINPEILKSRIEKIEKVLKWEQC